jgi:hypothetical protein
MAATTVLYSLTNVCKYSICNYNLVLKYMVIPWQSEVMQWLASNRAAKDCWLPAISFHRALAGPMAH